MICCEMGCDRVVVARNRCRCHYDKWYQVQILEAEVPSVKLPKDRKRQYRERHPDRVQSSSRQYCASEKGRATRAKANRRSNRWQSIIRTLNRAPSQDLRNQFPALLPDEIDLLVKNRPLTAKTLRLLLPEKSLVRFRQAVLTEPIGNAAIAK